MGSPPVLTGRERPARPVLQDPRAGWGALGTMAVALILVGATDLGLAFYPANFGSAEWRFSVLASVANGLPMLGVGILVVAVGALDARRQWAKGVAIGLNAAVLVAILVAAIGFLTAAGPAFETAAPEVHQGLWKAVVKSVTIFLAFGLAHAVGLISVARALRRGRPV